MPRYFFHVHDGDDFVDLQGTELPDLDAARREGVRFSGSLLAEKPERFWGSGEWTLRVADARDLTLFQLTFFATGAPSTMYTDTSRRPVDGGDDRDARARSQ